MNKKGFTLIELLSVITLITLISLIVLPNITENINKKKSEISAANMEILKNSADIYIEKNRNEYTQTYEANGSTYCIPIQTLIDNDILIKPFKDVSGKEIDYTKVLKATYDADYSSFAYDLVNSDSCTELINYTHKPQLIGSMIPVIYNENQNQWEKADINSNWYNYLNKKWANVVIVNELKNENPNSKTRSEYLNSPQGTKIEESDILAQFVWIPRFRYQIFDSNNQASINIVFESVTTEKSQGANNGEWLTHPAFTQNNEELLGIWIAKYESSNSSNNIIIKKDQTPWINIDYNEANEKSIKMSTPNNIYGITSGNTHMIENSEWAAVAYLSNSTYGINEQIPSSTNNLTGNSISTTNNMTGIFDMSGLNKEFVNTKNITENNPGQALIETKNWYNEQNTFETTEKMYIVRGNTSIFNYENSKSVNENTSFRVALTSNNQAPSYTKTYQITFDPNGGTVGQTSKEVTYNQTYGSLPTPTRSGYTFMGWRGKNIVDKTQSIKQGIRNEEPFSAWGETVFDNNWVINNLDPNKQYTISYEIEGISVPEYDSKYSGNLGLNLYSSGGNSIYLMSGDGKYISEGEKYKFQKTFTPPPNVQNPSSNFVIYAYSNRYLKNSTGVYSTIKMYNIQLEEGSTATDYEPYQTYTSDTIVTKGDNHTLYAIWQKNE